MRAFFEQCSFVLQIQQNGDYSGIHEFSQDLCSALIQKHSPLLHVGDTSGWTAPFCRVHEFILRLKAKKYLNVIFDQGKVDGTDLHHDFF